MASEIGTVANKVAFTAGMTSAIRVECARMTIHGVISEFARVLLILTSLPEDNRIFQSTLRARRGKNGDDSEAIKLPLYH